MKLRVGGNIDLEPVAAIFTDKCHQLVGIAEIADTTLSRRHVTAQRYQMTDIAAAIFVEQRGDLFAARRDTGDVRCRLVTFALDLQYRFQRAVTRRAARTESHGKELGVVLGQLLARFAQLGEPLRRLRREKFKTDDRLIHADIFIFL